jgi:hypothetical protein
MAQFGLLLAPSRVHVTPRFMFGTDLLVAFLFVCFFVVFAVSIFSATLSLPLQLLRNWDRGRESGTQDGMDVEVDFDLAVLEVEERRPGRVVIGRSRGGEMGLEEIGEGLREGWLVVVVVVAGRA